MKLGPVYLMYIHVCYVVTFKPIVHRIEAGQCQDASVLKCEVQCSSLKERYWIMIDMSTDVSTKENMYLCVCST